MTATEFLEEAQKSGKAPITLRKFTKKSKDISTRRSFISGGEKGVFIKSILPNFKNFNFEQACRSL